MSFLLDTNVISEAMKRSPAPVVLAWLEDNYEQCWLSSVSIAEIKLGIELLPEGRRRVGLEDALDRLVAGLQGRTVNFDLLVAHRRSARFRGAKNFLSDIGDAVYAALPPFPKTVRPCTHDNQAYPQSPPSPIGHPEPVEGSVQSPEQVGS